MTRKKVAQFVLLLLLVGQLAGCVAFIAGTAAGALGAYAISKDTVQGEVGKPYEAVWEAALTVSRIRGTIKHQDKAKGVIELQEDANAVTINLIRLARATTRLRITVRRYHLPNLGLAQDIFVKIVEQTE